MSNPLIVFENTDGATIHLPAAQIAYWKLTKGGALSLYATGGEPLHAVDAPGVLAQLEAAGLMPVPPAPAAPAAPPAVASQPKRHGR